MIRRSQTKYNDLYISTIDYLLQIDRYRWNSGESSKPWSGWNIRSVTSLLFFIYFSLNKKCYNVLWQTDEIDKTDNGKKVVNLIAMEIGVLSWIYADDVI